MKMTMVYFAIVILLSGLVSTAGEVVLDQRKLQHVKALKSDAAGTSGKAFRNIRQRLINQGFADIGTNPKVIVGKLPQIITFIQGKLDAKDLQISNKQDEINVHIDANEFKPAFVDQMLMNTLQLQRAQLQDYYNEIQSWAIAFLIRTGAGN